MTFYDWLGSVLTSAAAGTMFSGAILFIGKNLISKRLESAIKHEYDEKLEKLKSQLEANNSVELERLKGQLQLAATERSIRLGTVYEKTVDAAAGTYERLVALHDGVERYTAVFETPIMGTKEDRRKIVAERGTELMKFYRPKRPLLPAETVKSIDELIRLITATIHDFKHNVELNESVELGVSLQITKKWSECHDIIVKQVPPILSRLENDLRKLLGIYTDSDKPAAIT